MKVSIAMATYNGERYIQDQILSFADQTRVPDELVICDDGSTDRTLSVVEELRLGLPFDVRVYTNKVNLGYCKNFERALSLADGDLIFLSDQDDFWFPNKVELLCDYMLKKSDVLICQSNMIITDELLNDSGVTQLENILALGNSKKDFITGCGAVIRRDLLDVAIPFPSLGWGHDSWLFKIGNAIGVADLCEEPLMFYRRHDNTVSRHFASSVRRLSTVDALRQSGLRDATDGWKKEVVRCNDLLKRLDEKKEVLMKFRKDDSEKGVLVLKRRISSLEYRIKLMKTKGLTRWFSATVFLFLGGYGDFQGVKSFLKDCIRP